MCGSVDIPDLPEAQLLTRAEWGGNASLCGPGYVLWEQLFVLKESGVVYSSVVRCVWLDPWVSLLSASLASLVKTYMSASKIIPPQLKFFQPWNFPYIQLTGLICQWQNYWWSVLEKSNPLTILKYTVRLRMALPGTCLQKPVTGRQHLKPFPGTDRSMICLLLWVSSPVTSYKPVHYGYIWWLN